MVNPKVIRPALHRSRIACVANAFDNLRFVKYPSLIAAGTCQTIDFLWGNCQLNGITSLVK